MDDPYPMYQTYSELIEADGEAEEMFLEKTVDEGYAERYFFALDDISQDEIELDITDYMGNKAWATFEKAVNNYTEEEGELTYPKIDSWYRACIKAKR